MLPIRALQRLDDTILRLGGSGDNWHTTWAADDTQFTSLCDGSGWPGMPGYTGRSYNSRIYRLLGHPPAVRFEHLPAYPDLLSDPDTQPPSLHRYYNFGILALDGSVYSFLSTPNHIFEEPGARFIGAKLIYSPDNGETWHNQDGGPLVWEDRGERSRSNMLFFDEPGGAFSLLTALQMGRAYEHNRDGYAYLYAPNGNADGTMNQLVLCRVPKDRIRDRAAYEFFAGRQADGSATWTKAIEGRGIVHTFPAGWVNVHLHPYAWHPSVVYIAPLGLYLMANWGMGCTADSWWFGKPSYLGFWTAPEPWGPWTQVHEETAWMPGGDPHARAYQPQIVPKWIAADGRSFWLVWTDFQEIAGTLPYYAFNAQRVKVIV
jgi:hypothetical protein